MAHTCPDCGMVCYCGGDIDDIEMEEGSKGCVHYMSNECDAHAEIFGEDGDDDESDFD